MQLVLTSVWTIKLTLTVSKSNLMKMAHIVRHFFYLPLPIQLPHPKSAYKTFCKRKSVRTGCSRFAVKSVWYQRQSLKLTSLSPLVITSPPFLNNHGRQPRATAELFLRIININLPDLVPSTKMNSAANPANKAFTGRTEMAGIDLDTYRFLLAFTA